MNEPKDFWSTAERLVLLLGMLGVAFAAGENWHRLDGLEASVMGLSRQEDQIKSEYVRKDVLQEQLASINEKLIAIQRVADEGRR